MRIGVVTTSYPASEGDPAGSFVRGFARWLATQGARVEVLAPVRGAALGENEHENENRKENENGHGHGHGHGHEGEKGRGYDEVDDPGVTVERVRFAPQRFTRALATGLPDALERSRGAWVMGALAAGALTAAAARRHARWDALVTHWLVPCGAIGAALARRPKRPHLAIAHSGDVHLALRLGLAPRLARALLRSQTDVVFASAELRTAFLAGAGAHAEALAQASRVVAMGTSAGPPPSLAERAAARAALAPEAPLLLGFMGRLQPIKGVHHLIDAVHATGTQALIAGAGPERATLEARALAHQSRSVHFLGGLPAGSPAWRQFFAAIDALVVPSVELDGGRTEGTPVVIAEALAHGVPVLGAATGGVASAIGDAGLVHQTPTDLIENISKINTLRTCLEDLRRNAIARAPSVGWPQVGADLAAAMLPSRDGMAIVQRVNRVWPVTPASREEVSNRCSAISTSTVPSSSPSPTTRTSLAPASGRSPRT